MLPLAQMPTPLLPELPAGPSLDRVRGPINIPMFEPWQIGVLILLGVLFVGLLMWGIARFIRAQRNKHAPISAYRAALAELDTAATLTSDDDERFAVLSSLALRRYFENGLHTPALGLTTDEFLQRLQTRPELTAEIRTVLSSFMAQCDRIKFARQSISASERDSLTNSAREIVQQLEAHKELVKP
jgi:hypothetical protein